MCGLRGEIKRESWRLTGEKSEKDSCRVEISVKVISRCTLTALGV